MAFVYEKIPQKDRSFFDSMNFMHFSGNRKITILDDSKWLANREKNAFLIGIGRLPETPHYHALWWNGKKILMEVENRGAGNCNTGIDEIWNISGIKIPASIFPEKDQIVDMIKEAFSVKTPFDMKYVRSFTVNILGEPKSVEEVTHV